jgi:hypothetical protein
MSTRTSRPAPLETDPGHQMDDNIDDMGRRPGGKQEDQPVHPRPERTRDEEARSPKGD